MFVITRISLNRGSVPYILLQFWPGSEENRSLYRGLRFVEVGYIEVPLYEVSQLG